jgi:hypothetical protein
MSGTAAPGSEILPKPGGMTGFLQPLLSIAEAFWPCYLADSDDPIAF